MSEKLLEISGLSVCYEGEQILNNICFSVEKGETVGIAGESGSGKSTLLPSDPAADGKEWFHHRRADHISRRGADGHVRKEAAESVRFRNWYDFPEYRGITLSDPENRSTDL
mgnify:CR=1 FL=1